MPAMGEITNRLEEFKKSGLIADYELVVVDDSVRVRGAHLEGSNVSAIEEMVASMGLSRDFEIHMRLFKAADDMAATGNRLLRD